MAKLERVSRDKVAEGQARPRVKSDLTIDRLNQQAVR
jgi:hypothetical protein